MRRERAAIFYRHPLFGHGIGRLVAADPRYDVVSVSSLTPDCGKAARHLDLDVIVAEGEDSQHPAEVIDELPPVLVILVRLDTNLIDVYFKRQLVVPRPESLAEALAAAEKPA
ncbi:MAG: hypothetical protein ACE5EF_08295 [Dehalococcoidia bacterium]